MQTPLVVNEFRVAKSIPPTIVFMLLPAQHAGSAAPAQKKEKKAKSSGGGGGYTMAEVAKHTTTCQNQILAAGRLRPPEVRLNNVLGRVFDFLIFFLIFCPKKL